MSARAAVRATVTYVSIDPALRCFMSVRQTLSERDYELWISQIPIYLRVCMVAWKRELHKHSCARDVSTAPRPSAAGGEGTFLAAQGFTLPCIMKSEFKTAR